MSYIYTVHIFNVSLFMNHDGFIVNMWQWNVQSISNNFEVKDETIKLYTFVREMLVMI